MKTDPRVDAYISKSPAFAQPILTEVRQRILKACPSAEATIKWNVPFFLQSGKILASMAAFKKHVKVGVWMDMKPTMVDVTQVAELTPAKEFAAQLQAALKHIGGSTGAPPTEKAPAKKAPAKKASAKKAPAKKAPAKKTPAKEAAALAVKKTSKPAASKASRRAK